MAVATRSEILPSDNPPPIVSGGADSLMLLIERATMSPEFDVAKLEKLFEFKQRWDANNARKAFDEAVANAKANIPPIQRNATGHNSKKYADFAAIAKVVDPIIGQHGLSYRFRTVQTDRISVTCILSHKAGHSEETTLAGPADTSGNKNAIQAIGSTLSYLQRYSLIQMLGLAAAHDDDGKGAGSGDAISLAQVEQLVKLADEVFADKEAFCRYFKVESFADIKVNEFDRALAALNKKKAENALRIKRAAE